MLQVRIAVALRCESGGHHLLLDILWASSGNQWTFTNDEILFKSAERGKALLNQFQAMVSRSVERKATTETPSALRLKKYGTSSTPETGTIRQSFVSKLCLSVSENCHSLHFVQRQAEKCSGLCLSVRRWRVHAGDIHRWGMDGGNC